MTLAPNRADLDAYLDMVFGYLDPGEDEFTYAIALRGLGEKGTNGEGVFTDVQVMPPLHSPLQIDLIFGHVQRWSQHGRASFLVPAAVSARAMSDGHATEDRILQFTTIVVDFDKGDTGAALAHAVKHLGPASMVVLSGGTTEADHPKLHVYWRFTEPCSDVAGVALARKQLALKLGGDTSFGRSTQVIRIPGSCYSKNGQERLCSILSKSDAEYEPVELMQLITDMPAMAGIDLDMVKLGTMPVTLYSTGNGLNFSAFKAAKGDLAGEKPDIGTSLVSDIKEGGDVDRNRWGEFNRVAGYFISQARSGLITMADARAFSQNWMSMHMQPPFPPQRFETEFNGLVKADLRHHGAVAPAKLNNPNVNPPQDLVENLDGSLSVPVDLGDWKIGRWANGATPTRKFLVDGLIQLGKSHLLVAEGGAGKTFLLLDLAAKIAAHDPSQLQNWCGLPLSENAGGIAVMFTTEDDVEELQIRLADILTKEQRAKVQETLIILPTINAGGAFALVERQRAQGPAKIGERWRGHLESLRKIKNLKLVVIDTLNTTLHGEENSATVINEYVQAAASVICGELGAALVVTHHIRKPGANTKIYTPDDMKTAIRGSSALTGSFRVLIGIWAAPDYKNRLSRMALQPKRGLLYNLAVLKANNNEMDFGTRALMRQASGLLSDITDKEKALVATAQGELGAWALKAAEYAAKQTHPFTVKAMAKRPPGGRRFQLPPILHDLTEREMTNLCEKLIEEGRLVQCNPKGQTKYNYLDVPGGPLARADAAEDGTLYRLGMGKDFDAPDWLKVFAYHAVEQRIVEQGKELDRTIRQGSKPAPAKARTTPFNPNSEAQENVPPTVATNTSVKAEPEKILRPTPSADACDRATNLVFSPDCSNETKV